MTSIRNIIFTSLSFLFTISVLTSCDFVKEDERYILGPEVKAERAVLLEDFTGQYCVNCPEAHEVIKQLETQFGKDKVIAVSIHCGDFGIPVSVTNFSTGAVGLMTEEGNAIMSAYGINSFPMGVIDNGNPEIYDLWPTSVRNELQKPSHVDIDLHAKFEPDESKTEGITGTIKITANVLSGEDSDANIQFWITEDEIVSFQKTLDSTIYDYVHDNVFRAQVFPGVNGQSIKLQARETMKFTGSIVSKWTDKERWEVKNLSVVAFVSDKSGVLQAKRVKVES